jgi:16S rRNA (cytidine1402-2'-O)-methyltransferase
VSASAPPGEAPQPAAGTLFVVATPIGNLGDLSPRAAEVLRTVDRVLAEDTRRTRVLLSHVGASPASVERLDAHATPRELERAVEHLLAGQSLALVTDAGTPVVSDPGSALVRLSRQRGVRVVPLPGPSAVTAALSASGLGGGGGFVFLGFLPRSGRERARALSRVASTGEPVVLFESAERVRATLGELASDAPSREVVVARELTKLHEELVSGTLSELASDPRVWRGELCLVLGPIELRDEPPSDAELDGAIDQALARGASPRDVAEELAGLYGLRKRDVYQRVLARR